MIFANPSLTTSMPSTNNILRALFSAAVGFALLTSASLTNCQEWTQELNWAASASRGCALSIIGQTKWRIHLRPDRRNENGDRPENQRCRGLSAHRVR